MTPLSLDAFAACKTDGTYAVTFDGFTYPLSKQFPDPDGIEQIFIKNTEDVYCYYVEYEPCDNLFQSVDLLVRDIKKTCFLPPERTGSKLLQLTDALARAYGASAITLYDASTVHQNDTIIELPYLYMATHNPPLSWYEAWGYRPRNISQTAFDAIVAHRQQILADKMRDCLDRAAARNDERLWTYIARQLTPYLDLPLGQAIAGIDNVTIRNYALYVLEYNIEYNHMLVKTQSTV